MSVLKKTFAKDFSGAIKFSSLLLSCVLISPTTFNINSFLRHSWSTSVREGQKRDEAPAKFGEKCSEAAALLREGAGSEFLMSRSLLC